MKKPKQNPEWKPVKQKTSDQASKLILLVLVRKSILQVQISDDALKALDVESTLEFGTAEGLLCARTVKGMEPEPNTEEQRRCRLYLAFLQVLMLDHRYKTLVMSRQEEATIDKHHRLDVLPQSFKGGGFRLFVEPPSEPEK